MMGENQRWHFPRESWPQPCVCFSSANQLTFVLELKAAGQGDRNTSGVTQTRALVLPKVPHRHPYRFHLPHTQTHPLHTLTVTTRLRARRVSLLNPRQDQASEEPRGSIISEFISCRTLDSHP